MQADFPHTAYRWSLGYAVLHELHQCAAPLRVKRKGRNLRPGEVDKWTRDYFHSLGLHRLRGTVRYPETPIYGWDE